MRLLMVLICLVFTSCTGYNKYSVLGGYKDKEIRDNVYFVEYHVNTFTPKEKLKKYWGMRADELCPNGYEILENEEGELTGSMFGPGPGALVVHPWIKATIQCN